MKPRDYFGIQEVINVSGTMTSLGSSSVARPIIDAMCDVLPKFVDIVELQQRASRTVQRVIGAEAGCITSCAAAGIAISIAACMTGADMARVEQLPDTSGMCDEVLLQKGHSVWFGAGVPQMIRLAGAKPVEIGTVTRARKYQLEGVMNERVAAGLYVVSHHTVQYGLVSLEDFSSVLHARGVPVVVDAASESNMASFIARGADLVCFSGHKFLSGPTSGIIAGRSSLVEACVLHQLHGIGRAMKVGKEGIVGAMAALDQWASLDHQSESERQTRVLGRLYEGLKNVKGIEIGIVVDPTGNPIQRLKLAVDPNVLNLNAAQLSYALASGEPAVVVRDHEAVDQGFVQLDPCVVREDQVPKVIECIRRVADLSAERKEEIRAQSGQPHKQADADVCKAMSCFSEEDA